MPPHAWLPGPSSSDDSLRADLVSVDRIAPDQAAADWAGIEWLIDDDLALLTECARHRGGVDPCTELPPGFDFAWVGAKDDALLVATAVAPD